MFQACSKNDYQGMENFTGVGVLQPVLSEMLWNKVTNIYESRSP